MEIPNVVVCAHCGCKIRVGKDTVVLIASPAGAVIWCHNCYL